MRKIASKSNRVQRHSSTIFVGGTPFTWGYNNGKYHSEEMAIRRARNSTIGSTMVNIRLTRAGRIALAKPCPACMDLIKSKKFRKVIYSTNEGTFKEEYL